MNTPENGSFSVTPIADGWAKMEAKDWHAQLPPALTNIVRLVFYTGHSSALSVLCGSGKPMADADGRIVIEPLRILAMHGELTRFFDVQGMVIGTPPHEQGNHVRHFVDQPIPEDAAIHAAHPAFTQKYILFAEAQRLVRSKPSRGAMVELVNWLLVRATAAETALNNLTGRAE
jgi:hypothetical protein